MNQAYLDIARQYVSSSRAPSHASPPGVEEEILLPEQEARDPISLAAYRNSGSPRCRLCGLLLSIVAVRDICGRCAAPPKALKEAPTPRYSEEQQLRGQVLVELDKRHYPLLDFGGLRIGPGLEAWGPVLRDLSEPELQALLNRLSRRNQKRHEEVYNESAPGLW